MAVYKMMYSGKEIEELLAMIPGKTDVETVKRLIDSAIGKFDAPSDNKMYARRNGRWIELDANGNVKPYISLERICKYLYKVTFDTLHEDDGGGMLQNSGCSSYVRNGKLYRNLDWKYDNSASFIVKTKDFEGMSFVTGLDDGRMDDAKIAQLPYRIVDGRNNNGIMVSAHVLFNDWNYTGCGEKNISITRLPYLVLANVKSMDTIADDLDGVLENLVVPEGMGDYLLQVLVTDGDTTYVIAPPEVDNSEYVLIDISSNPKLANFRWVPDSHVDRDSSDLQERPTGVERWNLMPCNLEDLRFTIAYESPGRLSEFIGIGGTDKYSTDEELAETYSSAHAEYNSRDRDGSTWHTMHSVVYSENGIEELHVQEDWDANYGTGIISDAPSDGKRYVRRNGEWEEIESAGEMSVMLPPETPTSYGKPGQWSEDDTYLYFCTSPNVWIRLEKTTW